MSQTAAWLVFLALPAGLTPYWISVNEFGLFEWGKRYSVLLTAGWMIAIRCTWLHDQHWAVIGLTVLFGLNILEAVDVDLANRGLAPIMNAASGLLLVVMLPKSSRAIGRNETTADLEYEGLAQIWIIAFTIWNLTFHYLNYPAILGHHLAVLGVPLLIGLFRPQVWLQARLCLLAIDLMALATLGPVLIPLLDTTGLRELKWELFVAGTSLIGSLLSVFAIV